MCGIAGLMTRNGSPPPSAPLHEMAAALRQTVDGGGETEVFQDSWSEAARDVAHLVDAAADELLRGS